ncbi:hypothetical protein OZX69_03640 [Lactobacillus sp. ESL0731]|uniref:hypothetical protein n=1 Tax=unclassified Lactobacillus TaxID=2620435 RepID=UPI0023F734DF|nr:MULTISPECIES: hypothetical protein [unclassified Lactobacillus]WEV51802.1 hypothetical protein OZX63_03640 [Lactobacillus sp. ESL0700]WEV62931.1 hypothetical protein OZX69_03640 [Lactobacillus sp. ESL0731]
MNEKEFINFTKDRIFIFQSRAAEVYWVKVFLNGSAPENYLTIIFNSDHTLSFPARLGFYPAERGWQFDEAEQQIDLLDESGTIVVDRYALPQNPDDDHFILNNINDDAKRYLSFKEFAINKEVQPRAVLATQRLILISSDYQAVENQVDQCAIANSGNTKWLKSSLNSPWELINEAWETITQDTDLKEVCVFFGGTLTKDEHVFSEKLVRKQTEDELYISGSRANIIVTLSRMLILHYQERIMENGQLHSPIELLSQVITN